MARPKRSVSAADRLNAKSADPLGYLVDRFLGKHGKLTPEEKTSLALELLPYQCPKLKSVAVTHGGATEVIINIGGIGGTDG